MSVAKVARMPTHADALRYMKLAKAEVALKPPARGVAQGLLGDAWSWLRGAAKVTYNTAVSEFGGAGIKALEGLMKGLMW
jgi:hypothetical protein